MMVKNVIVCSNLIEHEGKFLLVKETKEIARDLYNFPSGTLEDNEEIRECAIREAKEESGLDVKPEQLVGLFQIPKSEMGNNILIYVFKSKIISGSLTVSDKHPEVAFFPFEQIKKFHEQKGLRHNSYLFYAIENYLQNKLVDLSMIKIL